MSSSTSSFLLSGTETKLACFKFSDIPLLSVSQTGSFGSFILCTVTNSANPLLIQSSANHVIQFKTLLGSRDDPCLDLFCKLLIDRLLHVNHHLSSLIVGFSLKRSPDDLLSRQSMLELVDKCLALMS
ncbi:hypothetical protein GEMRC1_004724 [Eukaryota sp. GEM-RC1]